MATIGQQLITPETGWKRYDDTCPAFMYKGTWTSTLLGGGPYGGTCYQSSVSTDKIKFNFIGTKIRIIGYQSSSRTNPISISIDGIIETFSELSIGTIGGSGGSMLVYEKTGLSHSTHQVEITPGGTTTALDAIDIDDTGRLLHPQEKLDPKDIAVIGDRIRCHYQASSGKVGVFSGLGQETSDFIPAASSATPNGDFYWIYSKDDHLGNKVFVADRNVQHSISWDTLNAMGIATHSGTQTAFSIYGGTAISSGDASVSPATNAFDGNYPIPLSGSANGTRWVSLQAGTTKGVAWIGYDFKQPKNICCIRLIQHSSTISYGVTSIIVQSSDDGVAWTNVYQKDNLSLGSYPSNDYIDFTSTGPKRFWRLLANSDATGGWYVYEMQMFEQSNVNTNYKFNTRLLTGGILSTDTDNEWDQIVVNSNLGGTIAAGDNGIWNWNGQYSLSSSTVNSTNTQRVIRGGTAVNRWGAYNTGGYGTDTGFRPVLVMSVLGEEEKPRTPKYVAQIGTDIYLPNGTLQGPRGTDAELKALMETNGADLSTIAWDTLRGIAKEAGKPLKVLRFTDDTAATVPTLRVTQVPDAQFITPKSSIRISSISGISSVKVTGTKTGAANERYVVAKSNVETGAPDWYVKTAAGWVSLGKLDRTIRADVDKVAQQGMTQEELNAITTAEWAQLFDNGHGTPQYNWIAFGYLQSQQSSTDVCENDQLVMEVNMQGKWVKAVHGTDYNYEYDGPEKLQVHILADGDYKFNRVPL
ncbi:F5/8 type C domain-containing protein [Aneurinibacillus soli]|uniref:F5/8 type C domain protein n=1 Tax=Aneurinibacillus soli TaxID=1500254 RepID=A0A0U5C7L0_9BACL|nr:discoidin domain-containing protein [Aneurinibacillus soli]PYE64262.1 F5/8 type C domain-containing protein [Aneurinibacillus soli]BAU28211.1 F5/8 type C domain protein [Aneurinibacillus soli]